MYHKKLYLNKLRTEAGIQQYIKDEFGFPDYYGKSLGALYDMLTAITGDTMVTLECEKNDSEYMKYVKDVFKDAAEDNDELYVEFV